MVALLALSAALLAAPQDAPRQRHLLPNGSVLLVERMPSARSVSVQLFASTRGIPEPPAAHGRRHLLEHLMAKGDGTLDERLEAEGLFLSASTLRDAMRFSITCPPERLDGALAVVRDLLKPFSTTDEAIAAEAEILRQEAAALPPESALSAAAWRAAYGARALDPAGSEAAIRATKPDDLRRLHAALFGADRLALAIAGPIDLDAAVAAGRAALRAAGPPVREAAEVRADGKPGRTEADATGEVVGAIVPDVRDPRTTWALAAALVVASRLEDPFVIYTPSAGDGLVLVGRTGGGESVGSVLAGLEPAERLAALPLGRRLVGEWVRGPLQTPAGAAWLRGLLLCQGASLRPEIVLENAAAMRPADLEAGFGMLEADRAVVVRGGIR